MTELRTLLDGLDDALAGADDLSPSERTQLGLCRSAIAFVLEGRRGTSASAARLQGQSDAGRGRIIIVEDDEPLRRALVEELSPGLACEGYADAESALAGLARDPSAAGFLVDYRLPGMDGLDFLREAFRRFPLGGVPAIVMTSLDDPALEERAYESGGVNFVRKPCEPRAVRLRLEAAIASAREGEERARRCLRARVSRALEDEGAAPSPVDESAAARYGLSPRELDVARLLAGGLQAKEIADGLGLSVHTVMNHLRNGYAKCGAGNRIEFLRRLSLR